MMPYEKMVTDSVKSLVQKLIDEKRDCLTGSRIEFVWFEAALDKHGNKKTPKPGSRVTLGKARAIGGPERLLFRTDFIIILDKDAWERMEPQAREALLYHELCHCEFDSKGTPRIRHHDVEEFLEVARDYGAWSSDLEEISSALGVQELPFGEPKIVRPEPEVEPAAAGVA